MVERLEDVWASRDFPVLVEVTRLIDSGKRPIMISQLAEDLGRSYDEVLISLQALGRRGLVDLTLTFGRGGHVDNVAGDAYLMTGLHPDGDDAVSQLIEAIGQAADRISDPEEKTRLRQLGSALGGVSRTVLAEVLAALAARGMFGA